MTMDTEARPFGPEQLLAHVDWVRGLARALVRGQGAQDVAQDTLLAALRHPPLAGRPVRPWLGTVLGNMLRTARRDERRRAQREQRQARESQVSAPSADVLLERMEAAKLMTELIGALAEPQRTTVLLRYFEEMSAVEIGRLQGVPAGTVRWRLKQAIDELRARLDERHGSRRAWLVVFAPLARPRLAHALPLTKLVKGTLVMNTSAKIAVGGLALALAVALFAWRLPPAPHARAGIPRLARTSARPLDEGAQVLDLDAARGALAGVVVNSAGQPIDGAFVAATPEGMKGGNDDRLVRARAVVRTGQGGRFNLDQLPPGRYGLTAIAARSAGASLPGIVLLPGEHLRGLTLTLGAGGMTVRGRVLDNGAGPIPRADVRAVTREGPTRLYQVAADDDGTFVLTLPNAVYTAVATAGGYASSSLELIPAREQAVTFRLDPAGQLRGRVVERGNARPVAGAVVTATVAELPWVDSRETIADAEGRFALADLEPGSYTVSASKDLLAGRLSGPARVAVEGPSPEALILVGRAAIVSGRVRDERGQGVPGVALRLLPERNWLAGHRVLAESGKDGAFRIVGVQPGRFTLLAERPPHAAAEHRGRRPVPRRGTARRRSPRLRHPPGQGSLMDAGGGSPGGADPGGHDHAGHRRQRRGHGALG